VKPGPPRGQSAGEHITVLCVEIEARKRGGRMLGSPRMRLAREEGQAMIEYALILTLIAVICILALTATGKSVADIIDLVAHSV
jgi:pilus assembly protein Flp/PilA